MQQYLNCISSFMKKHWCLRCFFVFSAPFRVGCLLFDMTLNYIISFLKIKQCFLVCKQSKFLSINTNIYLTTPSALSNLRALVLSLCFHGCAYVTTRLHNMRQELRRLAARICDVGFWRWQRGLDALVVESLSYSLADLVWLHLADYRPHGMSETLATAPLMPRSPSTAEFQPLEDREVEYFFASDASAVIEHTNRVIFLEVRAHCAQHLTQVKPVC